MPARIVLVLLVVAVLASCSAQTGDAPPSSATTEVVTTAPDSPATSSTTAPEGSSTTAPARPDGPTAPDFTVGLGEDRTASFVLSQEVKPVYMVFWAEW